MSLPTLLKDGERNDAEWKRKARDGINAVTRRVMSQGASTERPKGAVAGTQYYDFTLSKPIWLDAAGVWRDAAGTAV